MAHIIIDVVNEWTFQSFKGQEKFENTMCKDLSNFLRLSHDLHSYTSLKPYILLQNLIQSWMNLSLIPCP
jgi:hypothetical protein